MTAAVPHRDAWARYVILVDVGYLFAAAGDVVLGTHRRREFRVDLGVVQALVDRAGAELPGELLRVYWFDAARDRVPTVEHREVAALPHVKVRLGHVNRSGQQKGVDAQIRADLETLAANGAVTDAVLVAGDEDMVPAVEVAQAHGVRVHLWGVEPPYGSNQAERLVWEADTAALLSHDFLAPFVTAAPAVGERAAASVASVGATVEPTPLVSTQSEPAPAFVVPRPSDVFSPRRPPLPRPAPRLGPSHERMLEIGEHVAGTWLVTRGEENLSDLLPGPFLPPVIDQELLVAAESELGESLRAYEEARRALRDGFWARLYREFGFSVSSASSS